MKGGAPARAVLASAIVGCALVAGAVLGWWSLRDEGRSDAGGPGATALRDDARRWLSNHAGEIRRVAGVFGVSPVALGGIVAAEKSLLVGRVDAFEEEVFRTVFGSLAGDDLDRWVAEQESIYRSRVGSGSAPERAAIRNPYLWTLGPAQVSFRLAVQIESVVARRMGRRPRSASEVLDALTTPEGSLEYAAALLAAAKRAYRESGIDIADDPGVLATLYHLGAPEIRARRLVEENRVRIAEGDPTAPPRVNFYGAFVDRHAAEIAELLGVHPPRRSAERSG